MFIYYVYAYIRSKDSATAKSGTPYYIGKGKGNRAYNKHLNVPTPADRTKIVILESNLSEIGACALERRYIEWWGRKCLGNGILFNKADGGESTSGMVHTDTAKIKIGNANRGRYRQKSNNRKKASETNQKKYGVTNPLLQDWVRQKISETTRLRNLSQPIVECPYCEKRGQQNAMKRWHFENCKHQPGN